MNRIQQLEEELAQLQAKNDAAPTWGASVGAREERMKNIRSELSRLKEKQMRMPQSGDVYRHYKGTLYTVIAVGIDAETGKPKVYYCASGKHTEPPTMFDRPLENWLQSIDYPIQELGKEPRGPRFAFVAHLSPDTRCWYLPNVK